MNRRIGAKRAKLWVSSYNNLASAELKRIQLHRSCNTTPSLSTVMRSTATSSAVG